MRGHACASEESRRRVRRECMAGAFLRDFSWFENKVSDLHARDPRRAGLVDRDVIHRDACTPFRRPLTLLVIEASTIQIVACKWISIINGRRPLSTRCRAILDD